MIVPTCMKPMGMKPTGKGDAFQDKNNASAQLHLKSNII